MDELEPEKKNRSFLKIAVGVLIPCLLLVLGKLWEPTPEELRKIHEEKLAQRRLEWDIEQTGPFPITFVKPEEDGTWGRYYSTRIVAHNGIDRVEIKNLEGELVWEQSMDDFDPGDSNMNMKRDGHFWDVHVHVPKMPDGTYSIVVFDKNGNSFTKESYFGEK